MRSEPQQLMLCSDVPDSGEADDGIVLKQVRMTVVISRLENLSLAPRDANVSLD